MTAIECSRRLHPLWKWRKLCPIHSLQRQLDILRWYICGLTYQEIADKFGITKNGVRWNLDDMVEKGGFENREALVATAIENKLMVTTLKDE